MGGDLLPGHIQQVHLNTQVGCTGGSSRIVRVDMATTDSLDYLGLRCDECITVR
jgi:hypothetical protein